MPSHSVSLKEWISQHVRCLKPGEELTVSTRELQEITPHEYNGAVFYPPDQILESVLGSAYEFGYRENHAHQKVTFFRLEQPLSDDRRSYVSPDRRDLYRFDGLHYHYKGEQA